MEYHSFRIKRYYLLFFFINSTDYFVHVLLYMYLCASVRFLLYSSDKTEIKTRIFLLKKEKKRKRKFLIVKKKKKKYLIKYLLMVEFHDHHHHLHSFPSYCYMDYLENKTEKSLRIIRLFLYLLKSAGK